MHQISMYLQTADSNTNELHLEYKVFLNIVVIYHLIYKNNHYLCLKN